MQLNRPSGAPPARGTIALFDHLTRLGKYRKGRRVVELHLSRLAPENRHDHHRRISYTVFTSSLKGLEGDLFVLGSGDLVYVGHTSDALAIDSALQKQQALFKDDPLLSDAEPGDETSGLYTGYDLEKDYDTLMQRVRTIAQQENKRQAAQREQERQQQTAKKNPQGPKQPLDLDRLVRLEKVLSSADISNLIRYQPVCAITSSMMPQRVLDECFTSISDLERVLQPGTDMTRNRGLFQYLTQILDDRLLAYLKHDGGDRSERFFSINLNVGSILSPAFLAFDANLPVGVRGTIVIELQQADVFADLRAFAFARDYVRERGYRVCLDGVTADSLAFIDRRQLGVDLVKLHWSPDLACDPGSKRGQELRRLAGVIGADHIILHRCEDEDAVRIGQALGITMYQGHHVDSLLPLSERRGRSALDPMH
jgi:EAL domain-containing protein (putative c-di-GMP-specific phosphodiesterase class I)